MSSLSSSSPSLSATAPKSSSYSSGLSSSTDAAQRSKLSRRLEDLAVVNGLLAHMASDDDFHGRLAEPVVKKAMDHWTNKNRQSPEEAEKFNENTDVIRVYDRIRKLQDALRKAEFKIDFRLIFGRISHLHLDLVLESFGDEILIHPQFPYKDYGLSPPPKPISLAPTSATNNTTSPINNQKAPNDANNGNIKEDDIADNKILDANYTQESYSSIFWNLFIQMLLVLVFSLLLAKFGFENFYKTETSKT